MVKKKTKSTRKLRKRADSWTDEDVRASTSLPPQVEGQLRCHLKLSVNQILWMIANPPEETNVRLLWWGEFGEGTVFRPVDVKNKDKGVSRTTARFPIRSGPKQFAAYLNDMSSLVLEVLSGPMLLVIGRAQVDHIGNLAPNRPINGFFPVFSADSEKIAELQVSVVLESLMASYDSQSTVPTPDMSLDMYSGIVEPPVNPPRAVPAPQPRPASYSPMEDPFRSPGAHKAVGKSAPRGLDAHMFGAANPLRDSVQSQSSGPQTSSNPNYPRTRPPEVSGYPTSSNPSYPQSSQRDDELRNTLDSQASTLKGIGSLQSEVVSSGADDRGLSASSDKKTTSYSGYSSSEHKGAGGVDLVSALLVKGTKLREAMILSTLDSGQSDKPGTDRNDTPRGVEMFSPLRRKDSSGDLFREILNPEQNPDKLFTTETSDTEGRTVDLVIGNHISDKEFKMLRALGGSPGSSVSGDDKYMDSDIGDPIHDDSILEDLFYKASSDESEPELSDMEDIPSSLRKSRSNASLASLEDPGNARPPSRQSSCSSFTLDQEPVRETDPIPPRSKTGSRSRSKPLKDKNDKTSANKQSKPKGFQEKQNRSRSKSKEADQKNPRSRSRSRSRERRKTKGRRPSQPSDLDVPDSPRASETSRVSFDPVPSDVDEDLRPVRGSRHKPVVDGLSIERLTLLGRVSVARVMVDHYVQTEDPALDTSLSTPRSRARAQRGKPPRPSLKPKKNCTYFVEYQFPVVATSRDKYQPNAMATEVMRVASKKILDNVVNFGHRSVFPVLFDGDSVEKWWKSALIFKVYSKTPGQKVPRLLGMCSVTLKSVLKSEALFITRDVEVKDRSSGRSDSSRGGNDSFWPVVGNLKISIELASDSKDFSSALARTRLAELTHPNVIPIPQPREGRGNKEGRSNRGGRGNGEGRGRSREGRDQSNEGRSRSRSFSREREERYSSFDTSRSPYNMGSAAGTQTEPQTTNINSLPLAPPPQPRLQPRPPPTDILQQELLVEPIESLTLHTLLLAPEGMNITLQGVPSIRHGNKQPSNPPRPLTGWTGRDMATRNLYLVGRMFWSDDVARSGVCWGTFDPQFNFLQVAPMLLTASLLERMRNNFMIIEVWDKKTCSENDQLVGIVKLPLHQFYMSYRDRKVAASLLKSQYPVVSVDKEMPIVNPFSGDEFGKLKVLLAMGSMEQVAGLQRLKSDQGTAVMVPDRPAHYLERHDVYTDSRNHGNFQPNQDNIVEHTFEVCVEGIKGLKLLDNMIWGEADCFLQYHFPAQTNTKQKGGPNIIHATPSLQTFRTATTLCIPDPVFNDVLRHRITLPEGSPVQREILTACAGVGGGVGGIPFEVWCRYYYPNVRDQVIAKGTLPLAKLCAMVTMQRRGEQNTQTFSLPLNSLVPDSDPQDTESPHIPQCGLLDVTINYKTSIQKGESQPHTEAMSRSLPGATVCVAVSINRAAGLKASVMALARHDASLQYPAEVGVNTYVRVKLSFLQKEDERLTRTVARTFAPDFSYHLDFPCPLLWTELGSDALSLAEILENAEAIFELWHQAPGSPFGTDHQYSNTGSSEVAGRRLVSLGGDILLGTVTVPLISLLTRKTGVSGWFPVNLPSLGWETHTQNDTDQSEAGLHGNRGLERVVGGLDLSIKFAHHEDLERVVHAARGVGWSPDFDVEHRDWQSADEMLEYYHQLVVSVDVCVFPVHNALVMGQTRLDQTARCYVRYKVYDKGAICSRVSGLEQNDDGYVASELQHNRTYIIAGSAPFSWYLREEHLEVQVWVTFHTEDGENKRPRNRDKLIGSAYIDLATLTDPRRRQHRVSGLYPLYKPGSSSLGGACIRAHVLLRPHTGELVESEEEELSFAHPRRKRSPVRSPVKKSPEKTDASEASFAVDLDNTFPVHISIERGLHLPLSTDKGVSHAPSCYVSYQTADHAEVSCTEIISNTTDPVWNHNHDTRLGTELLTQSSKNLVFKVWHKPEGVSTIPDKSTDRVLGFVSVDLCPLTTGFFQLCGWYNIMDFNGQCQGQIKVAILPQQPLTDLKQTTSPGSQQRSQPLTTGFPNPMIQGLYQNWYPEHQPAMQSGMTAEDSASDNLPHFSEHLKNVKKYHRQLQDKMEEMGVVDPNTATRSILFSHLRTNLGELDQITAKLKQKLHMPATTVSDYTATMDQHTLGTTSTTASDPMFTGVTTLGHTITSEQSSQSEGLTMTQPLRTEDVEYLRNEIENLELQNKLAVTGLHTRGYEAGSEDNLGSTLGANQEFLSTQNTDLDSLLDRNDIEKSENDQTIFSATLSHAQNVLKAIHQAQAKYNPRDDLGKESAQSTMSGVMEGQGDMQYSLDFTSGHHHLDQYEAHGMSTTETSDNRLGTQVSSEPYYDETRDVLLADGGVQHKQHQQPSETYPEDSYREVNPRYEDGDEEWEEDEDTFSKAWAARPSDQQSDIFSEISHNEDEEVPVVVPRPLNDISSATFSNGFDDSYKMGTETKQALWAAAENIDSNSQDPDSDPGHTDPNLVHQDAGLATQTTDKTDDTFFATRDTTWKGDLSPMEFDMTNKTALDCVQFEDTESGPSKLGSDRSEGQPMTTSVTIEPSGILAEEDPHMRSVSRTSLSSNSSSSKRSRSKNARKAAMFRREYNRHREEDGGSSSELGEDSLSPQRKHYSQSPQRKHRLQTSAMTAQTDNRSAEVLYNGHTDRRPVDDFEQMESSELNGLLPAEKDEYQDELLSTNQEEDISNTERRSEGISDPSQTTSSRAPNYHMNNSQAVPNFFLPPSDLEQTMRTLTTSTLSSVRTNHQVDPRVLLEKAEVSREYVSRIDKSRKPVASKHKVQPSQEQSQRIARIFAQKFS